MASIVALTALTAVPADADEVETAAQVHLDRGIAAYNAADWTLAREEFRAARELVPHKPNPYRWLALTAVRIGACADARLDVDSFLARVAANDPRIGELERARDGCVPRGLPVVRDDPRPSPPASVTARPLVTRWWVWTIVGGAALALTGIALYATHDDGPTLLPAVRCDATGCR